LSARPSMTARMVARQRALLGPARPARGDADAEQRLYDALNAGRRLPVRTLAGPEGMAARTRFYDNQVLAALDRGVPQAVILGAGFDGRALRFSDGGCRWIEVDRAATQESKRRLLSAAGAPTGRISFVTADLHDPDLGSRLSAGGHDPNVPTLWLCEGVLPYISAEGIRDLGRRLLELSAMGSILLVNALVQPGRRGFQALTVGAVIDGLLALMGERRQSLFGPGEFEALLYSAGWQVTVHGDPGPARADGTVMAAVAAIPVGAALPTA
jgi:methyltransferase (TIGR00027 family)